MNPSSPIQTGRRDFLQKTTGATAAILSAPFIARAQGNQSTIKVGLIGCGGRGSGAADQALKADPNVQLWAMGDAFGNQLRRTLESFKAGAHGAAGKIIVPEDRQMVGLDAYQKVLQSGVDVVILATPPGFRPQHLRAAIEAGKHVFCEKPMAVDMPGVRSVIESARMAKEKGLCLVSGFCWRYSASRRAAFERVLGGDIGDITAYYATYYTGPVKPMPPKGSRPEGMGDVEWQVRNWYNFGWTCGDSLVEQAVHSIDKINWAMRNQEPIAAIGNGGRQLPNGEGNKLAEGEGNIFDHFNVTYEYPEGVHCFMASRQIPRCFGENADYIHGTKGRCVINSGQPRIFGEKEWRTRSEEDNDMYQEEHNTLFKAIRAGQTPNDGEFMTRSTTLAIMGRMACYTGKRITWEELQKSTLDLAPDDLKMTDTFDPGPVPSPGLTAMT